MNQTITRLLCACTFMACLLVNPSFAAEPPEEPDDFTPAYVRSHDAWVGLYGRGDQHVEYVVAGREVELQDARHILLKPGLGLMVNFADKAQFGAGSDMLDAHKNWELDYQRQQAGKLESRDRADLAEGRHDLRVTEFTIPGPEGKPLTNYLIGLALKDGVFVFSISPVTADIDPLVKKLIASIRLVNEPLDLVAEAKRLRAEPKQKH